MGNECHKQITARKEICDTWGNLWILGNKAIVQHLIINVSLTFTSKENTFLIKCKKQLITASFLCCLFLKCVALDLEILHPTCSWNETCGTFLIWSGFFFLFLFYEGRWCSFSSSTDEWSLNVEPCSSYKWTWSMAALQRGASPEGIHFL